MAAVDNGTTYNVGTQTAFGDAWGATWPAMQCQPFFLAFQLIPIFFTVPLPLAAPWGGGTPSTEHFAERFSSFDAGAGPFAQPVHPQSPWWWLHPGRQGQGQGQQGQGQEQQQQAQPTREPPAPASGGEAAATWARPAGGPPQTFDAFDIFSDTATVEAAGPTSIEREYASLYPEPHCHASAESTTARIATADASTNCRPTRPATAESSTQTCNEGCLNDYDKDDVDLAGLLSADPETVFNFDAVKTMDVPSATGKASLPKKKGNKPRKKHGGGRNGSDCDDESHASTTPSGTSSSASTVKSQAAEAMSEVPGEPPPVQAKSPMSRLPPDKPVQESSGLSASSTGALSYANQPPDKPVQESGDLSTSSKNCVNQQPDKLVQESGNLSTSSKNCVNQQPDKPVHESTGLSTSSKSALSCTDRLPDKPVQESSGLSTSSKGALSWADATDKQVHESGGLSTSSRGALSWADATEQQRSDDADSVSIISEAITDITELRQKCKRKLKSLRLDTGVIEKCDCHTLLAMCKSLSITA